MNRPLAMSPSRRPRIRPAQLAMLAVLAACLPGGADAGGTGQAAGKDALTELAPVTINRVRNPGDLPYAGFLQSIRHLQSYLPPEPRVLDLRLRLSFTGLGEAERDAYLPDTWAVAIVGDTFDHPVAVERGGYFLLPELPQAANEGATIMFNAQTRKDYMQVAWKFRVAPGQLLAYADFAKAFDEVAFVQKNIPLYRINLRDERLARFDGLKACFHPGGGRIEIDGQPAPTTNVGACSVLRFDPAIAKAGQARIAFVGPLDTVTLHETVR